MTTVSSFMVRPRGYIDVSDYVPQSDAADCYAGIQAALIAGAGREVVFRSPYNGSRTYRLLNRGSGRLLAPLTGKITWDTSAWLNTEAWGKSGTASPILYAAATVTDITLDATAVGGTRTIVLPTGQGATFARGMAFIINSTELYTPLDGPIGTIGEWAEVAGVAGDTLTLTAELFFTYDIGLGTVKIHRSAQWIDLDLKNPQVQGSGLFTAANTQGDRGIELVGVKRLDVEGGEVRDSDAHSLIVHNPYSLHVTGFSSRKFEASPGGNTRTRYGIAIVGNTSIVRVIDCDLMGGTEQIALTTSGYPSGVKRNVAIKGGRHTGAERSGITTHYDYDPGSYLIEGNQFYDCAQAADMRLGGMFNDNMVRSSTGTLDNAVQLGAGFKFFSSSGNDIEDVLRGYYLPPDLNHFRAPGSVTITGDVMRNVRGVGVYLDYNGKYFKVSDGPPEVYDRTNRDDVLGTITVNADITLAASGAPTGVLARGKWSNADIDVTVRGGTMSGRSVNMERATSSILGTGGPGNPVIRERVEQTTNPARVVQSSTLAASVSIQTEIMGKPRPRTLSGTGTPEGVVSAPEGSTYTRLDGGTGTTEYVKPLGSGAGNTGWVALESRIRGNGSPEGVVTAPRGTTYTRLDGGAGTTLYVKETGTGNTGWAAK